MTYLQAIILGIVQGVTEFLPVSSTGHLVLTPFYFGWQIPQKEAYLFDILSQVATLAAVFAYFWTDIVSILKALWSGLEHRDPFSDPQARLGWLLLLASVPAGIIGLLFKANFENAFNNPGATAWFLLGTAGLLTIAERAGRQTRRLRSLGWQDALWIGVFQILALYPGISRSGASITGGMIRNLDRPSSARFSFLMSVPIMLAAGASALFDLRSLSNVSTALPPMLLGFLTAALVGYVSIRWLLGFLGRRSFYVFVVYCALAGAVTLVKYYAL